MAVQRLEETIDRAGKTVDFRLSARRDVAAAKAFFAKAIKSQGLAPKTLTLDGYAASHRAVREMRLTSRCRTQIQNVALAYTKNSLVTSGTATSPTVSVTPTGGCASAGSSNPLQVNISYTYNGVVLGSAFSAITGPITVKAVAVKNCE